MAALLPSPPLQLLLLLLLFLHHPCVCLTAAAASPSSTGTATTTVLFHVAAHLQLYHELRLHQNASIFSSSSSSSAEWQQGEVVHAPSGTLAQRLQRDQARLDAIGQRLSSSSTASSSASFSASSSLASSSASSSSAGRVTSGLRYDSGEYFVKLAVGTPSRAQYAVLDTGSDLTWLQCSPCRRCYPQSDPLFRPRRSSTYNPLPSSSSACRNLSSSSSSSNSSSCSYLVAYGDGSFTAGNLGSDVFDLGPQQRRRLLFGCGHNNQGLFVGAAGLLGMGSGTLGLPAQLASSAFSYCLVSRGQPPRVSSPLLLGGAASARTTAASFVLARLLHNPRLPSFYYAAVSGLAVGGAPLTGGGVATALRLDPLTGRGGVIVDSGTSVTRLPPPAYAALRAAFRAAAARVSLPPAPPFSLFDTCFDLSGAASSSVLVPTLTLHFDTGASLQLPPANYLLLVDPANATFCFAFASSSLPVTILGNIQQQTMRIAFDTAASRIGFAAAQCP